MSNEILIIVIDRIAFAKQADNALGSVHCPSVRVSEFLIPPAWTIWPMTLIFCELFAIAALDKTDQPWERTQADRRKLPIASASSPCFAVDNKARMKELPYTANVLQTCACIWNGIVTINKSDTNVYSPKSRPQYWMITVIIIQILISTHLKDTSYTWSAKQLSVTFCSIPCSAS